MRVKTASLGLLALGMASTFGAAWLAVDLRHAFKVALIVVAAGCAIGLIVCFFAWLDGED